MIRAWRRIAVPAAAFALVLAAVPAAVGFADEPPKAGPSEPAAPPAPTPKAGNQEEAAKAFDQGEVKREEGKWLEAVKFFGDAVNADEGMWLGNVRYQEAALAAGAGADLVKEYDTLVKEKPDDLPLKLHRMRLDPPALRIEALNAMLKAKPGERLALLELGRALLAMGDAEKAKKALEAVWAQRPEVGEPLYLSAEALRKSGDAAGARARLEGAVKQSPELFEAILDLSRLDLLEGKFEDALKRADSVLTMRPSYLAAMLIRSEACLRLGKVEDARAALDTALRVNPDDAEALVASADLMAKGAKEEGLKKAVELYRKALASKTAPQLRALYGLGWAQERLGMLPEAASSYREASLLAPSDAAIVNSVGVVFLKQKKFADALLQFKKAIDLDPLSPEAYSNTGAVSDEQSDWNEAIKWYMKVLALKGQDKNVRALLNAAFDHEALSGYKKAEELLLRVRVIRPDDAEVATYYGDNQFFQHKWKNAIKAYQDATKLDEKNRFAWRGLGLSLVQDDKDEDAVAPLEKAKALKKDDPATLLALGDIYSGNGDARDLPKAVENYEAYLKAGGSNTDVQTIVDEIKKEIAAGKK